MRYNVPAYSHAVFTFWKLKKGEWQRRGKWEKKAKRDAFDDDDGKNLHSKMRRRQRKGKERKSWSFNASISSTSNCSHLNLYYIYFIISPQVYACNKREAKNTIKNFFLCFSFAPAAFFSPSQKGFFGWARATFLQSTHKKNYFNVSLDELLLDFLFKFGTSLKQPSKFKKY